MFANQSGDRDESRRSSRPDVVREDRQNSPTRGASEKSAPVTSRPDREREERPEISTSFSLRSAAGLVAGKQLAPGILLDCLGIHFVKVPPRTLFSYLKQNGDEFVDRLAQQSITAYSPSTDAIKILSRTIKLLNRDSDPTDHALALKILSAATTIDRRNPQNSDWDHRCSLYLNGRGFDLSLKLTKPSFLHRIAAQFNPDISTEAKKSKLWFQLKLSPEVPASVSKVERGLALATTTLGLVGTPVGISLVSMQAGVPYFVGAGASLIATAALCLGAIRYKRYLARTVDE